MPRAKDDYVYFWKPTDPVVGWAGQWYPSPFTGTIHMPLASSSSQELVETEAHFPTAEHWMMVGKALLFKDYEIAQTILDVKGDGPGHCRKVKGLGQKVKGFEESVWVRERSKIVYDGNILKFRQNPELKQKLLETGDKVLVEASPTDKIWGIGLGEKKARETAKHRNGWGLNLLGNALGEVREILRKEEASPAEGALKS